MSFAETTESVVNPQLRAPYSTGPTGPSSVEQLREIVRKHRACYEVWPEWSGCGGRARRIGYGLSLCGVNEGNNCSHGHHLPGCQHCSFTYDALCRIAQWITQKNHQGCRYEIGAFDRGWHIAPRHRSSRNEILVTIKILHVYDVDAPVDDNQQYCLNELRAELREVGVHEGVWHPSAVAAR